MAEIACSLTRLINKLREERGGGGSAGAVTGTQHQRRRRGQGVRVRVQEQCPVLHIAGSSGNSSSGCGSGGGNSGGSGGSLTRLVDKLREEHRGAATGQSPAHSGPSWFVP
jgi:hypothetical protein